MPNIKVCLKCRQKFDILSEDYVKINRRYLHKECYESDKKRYDKMAEAGEKKKQTVKAALEASEQSIMKKTIIGRKNISTGKIRLSQ